MLFEELAHDHERDLHRTIRLEMRHKKKDGGYFEAELATNFIRDGDGQPLGLNVIIQDLDGLFGSLLPENIDVETVLDQDLGVIEGDAAQLEQVVMNLVVNARDAMLEGGDLIIETKNISFSKDELIDYPWAQVGDFVRLRMTDSGLGISSEIKDRILEPFFKTKPEVEETGLGLSVYFGVIKQHKGFTRVRSSSNEGAQFNTYFPIENSTVADRKNSEEQIVLSGVETILLVEDDTQVRNLAIEILSGAGYRVLDAENGLLGVEVFRKHQDQISLVILDVMMPVMNGHEAMNQIKKMNAITPVLFTSGYSEEGIHTDFILPEDLSLLEKPYGLRDFLGKVRQMIDAKA